MLAGSWSLFVSVLILLHQIERVWSKIVPQTKLVDDFKGASPAPTITAEDGRHPKELYPYLHMGFVPVPPGQMSQIRKGLYRPAGRLDIREIIRRQGECGGEGEPECCGGEGEPACDDGGGGTTTSTTIAGGGGGGGGTCPDGYIKSCPDTEEKPCCINTKPICCVNNGGCCENGYVCAGTFANPGCCVSGSVICPNGSCCEHGGTCCGSTCCDPGITCCGSTCCEKGYRCVQGECVDPSLASLSEQSTLSTRSTLSIQSELSALSTRSVLSLQSILSVQSVASVQSGAGIQSLSLQSVQSVLSVQSTASLQSVASLQSIASLSQQSVLSVQSIQSVASLQPGSSTQAIVPTSSSHSAESTTSTQSAEPAPSSSEDLVQSSYFIQASISSALVTQAGYSDTNTITTAHVKPTDTRIKYSPLNAWIDSSGVGTSNYSLIGTCTNGTKVTQTAGAKLTFIFRGTSISIDIVPSSEGGRFAVELDGRPPVDYDSTSSNNSTSNQCITSPLVSINGIEDVPHQIVVTNGVRPSGSTGGKLEISGITYTGRGAFGTPEDKPGPPSPAIIGGSVGGAVGAIVIGGIIFVMYRKRRSGNANNGANNGGAGQGGQGGAATDNQMVQQIAAPAVYTIPSGPPFPTGTGHQPFPSQTQHQPFGYPQQQPQQPQYSFQQAQPSYQFGQGGTTTITPAPPLPPWVQRASEPNDAASAPFRPADAGSMTSATHSQVNIQTAGMADPSSVSNEPARKPNPFYGSHWAPNAPGYSTGQY
ncbi:hypothetical protein FRC20_002528 [Serendipita sp. 405]|nr:hypothetical protein FRC20_002528 [Serendipita sp. 405]